MRISDLVKKIILVFGGVIVLGAAIMIIVSLFNRKDDDEAFSNGEKTYFVTPTDAPSTDATTEATTEYIATEPELIEDTTQDTASSTDTVQKPVTVTAAAIVEDKDMLDEKDPFFLICPSSVSIVKGKTFDAEEYVGYADDYDRDVELEVSGEVDSSTTGSYPVKLTLKDDAGHTKTNNMTVIVTESGYEIITMYEGEK